ncbi:MAG TPA: hypothetical protein VLA79_04830 [Polyangia bacterium]|nr:hypothetical protein [Polyangia bacterium]
MSRPMFRASRLLALLFVAAIVALPAVAGAQMTQGPPTPMATDLSKITVGSWAKYDMIMGTMPPMTMKMALVNRSAAGNSLEMSVEGGMAARAGNVVTQMTLAPGSTGSVQKLVLQVGTNDPMEMPIEGAQAHQFAKPDPKTLVKAETIKVAAGSYKTKHYHDKTPQGDTVDYWVTESVAPIGLVKIEMTQKSNPMINGPIKMELTSVGKDAKALITKKAKPFDQSALMKEMMAGSGAPGGAAPAGN